MTSEQEKRDLHVPVEDSVVFDEGVFEKIAGRVARETPGVLDVRGNVISRLAGTVSEDLVRAGDGVYAETEAQKVFLHIKIVMAYKAKAPVIFEDIRRQLTTDIKTMTGYDLAQLKVEVVDIFTPEAYHAQRQQTSPKTTDAV